MIEKEARFMISHINKLMELAYVAYKAITHKKTSLSLENIFKEMSSVTSSVEHLSDDIKKTYNPTGAEAGLFLNCLKGVTNSDINTFIAKKMQKNQDDTIEMAVLNYRRNRL